MTVDTSERTAVPAAPRRRLSRGRVLLLSVAGVVLLLSLTRVVTGADVLTSSGTAGALLVLALPIALAGLGGLIAERAGVVNIGLEGMLILGTWGAGWAGFQWGPWAALLAAVVGGALGGLLHAVATVTFGVNHIISGVAINLLAAGFVRFLSELFLVGRSGGGATQSASIVGSVPRVSLPVLSSGPDLLGRLEATRVPVLADLGGLLGGLTRDVSVFQVAAVLLFPLVGWMLWRTRLGLRWRSSGEAPTAAETLGVDVVRIRYLAVTLSGALAGFGGLFLVLFAGRYIEGQTGGRGYIGLAAMIFGNWRPGGLLSGSLLFGFTDALRLRAPDAVIALLLLVAVVLLVLAVVSFVRHRRVATVLAGATGVVALLGWLLLDSLPLQVVATTPYIVTLVVLAVASQSLRPPRAAGLPYRRGQA
ncbi:ABC transporter permease [Pseudokineococcus marinus]|uniref:ABC transporter permease n=1 Tax=Pseudokineococcus marinus TaxID=351215 RepID=UPI001BB2DE54|nr:ABC transporter permease [Pseudokineococcus marinus]